MKWYHYIIAQLILLFGIFNNYCNIAFVAADISDIFISVPVGLSGCLLVYLISKMDLKGGILGYIGKNSMTVLCTHLYALETMGPYFNRFLDLLDLNGANRVWASIMLEIFFAVCTAFVIEIMKKMIIQISEKKRWRNVNVYNRGDSAVDVARGIFIISMLVGHFYISSTLRSIIYSCHMIAFIFFSGYFYKRGHNIWKQIIHLIHTFLLPYFIFVVFIFIFLTNFKEINYAYLIKIFVRYSLGMSFSNRIFPYVPSIGPIYFILMLFAIRFVYLFVDYGIENEKYKLLFVSCISLLGVSFGKKGLWLPWSIDIASYALIFYQIGIYCRKYDLLSKVRDNHVFYFILTPVWAYMIYMGGMEIAVRDYGSYGLGIIGSVAGILMIYKLSVYISDVMPVTKEMLCLTGESSLTILIIHTIFNEKVQNLALYDFNNQSILYMVCVVLLQIILSCIIKKVLCQVRVLQ